MLAEGLRAQEAGAQALVLTVVVASAATRMIAVAGSLSWIDMGTPASIESAACVTVMAETLMHRDRGTLPTALWCLVDRHVLARMPRERALAGVELVLPRQRALCLLRRRTLKKRVNLVVSPMILGRCGL